MVGIGRAIRGGRSSNTGPTSKSRSPRQRVEHRPKEAAVTSPIRVTEIIDLTDDTEHCAICPNTLLYGNGPAARAFAFSICNCVICGECIFGNMAKEDHELRAIVVINVYCPKRHHFEAGEQKAYEIFGLDCPICLNPASSDGNGIRTACGHAFCRSCLDSLFIHYRRPTCPSCRRSLEWERCSRFRTLQRGCVSVVASSRSPSEG
ncbi:hypothetical protein BDZ45DRAFT_92701 [Acephala macrosclerotiorum]|nr:hypothetical protein BDZ45DRAFT_92701 [Acephala macrosclerotiorum]